GEREVGRRIVVLGITPPVRLAPVGRTEEVEAEAEAPAALRPGDRVVSERRADLGEGPDRQDGTRAATNDTMERVAALIRDVPDFPQPGIVFKDITPLLADDLAFSSVIDLI